MKITTRVIGGKYIEILIESNGTSIDLGWYGESEAVRLVESFEYAVDELNTFVSNLRERAIAAAQEQGE